MAYIQVNIQRQMDTYAAIRDVGGVDCVRDVYVVKSCTSSPVDVAVNADISAAADATAVPQKSKFWYVGKIALAGVSEAQAIARQWNLIEEHAARLRPVELGRSFGELQIFVAPGDSELQVQNNLQRLVEPPVPRGRRLLGDMTIESVLPSECGFLCEVVTNMGVGFHVERAPDGSIMDSEG